jgi:hypothetical protein
MQGIWQWSEVHANPAIGDPPIAREGHSATVFRNYLVIFGGLSVRGEVCVSSHSPERYVCMYVCMYVCVSSHSSERYVCMYVCMYVYPLIALKDRFALQVLRFPRLLTP